MYRNPYYRLHHHHCLYRYIRAQQTLLWKCSYIHSQSHCCFSNKNELYMYCTYVYRLRTILDWLKRRTRCFCSLHILSKASTTIIFPDLFPQPNRSSLYLLSPSLFASLLRVLSRLLRRWGLLDLMKAVSSASSPSPSSSPSSLPLVAQSR